MNYFRFIINYKYYLLLQNYIIKYSNKVVNSILRILDIKEDLE